MQAALLAFTAISAVSQIVSAGQQADAAEYNAEVAEREAEAARQTAGFEEQQHRRRVSRILASQRAGYAASGVTFEGSPLLVMADSAQQAEVDALAIRRAGSIEESRALSQAALDRLQARNIRTAGYLGAAATIASGGYRSSLLGSGGSSISVPKVG